jgi:hypothetical protein
LWRIAVLVLLSGAAVSVLIEPRWSAAQVVVVPQVIIDPSLLLITRYPDVGGPGNVYARNPWDMQVFNGRIYFAHGNALENTGATPIISYDPNDLVTPFTNEFATNAEQLARYRIIGGQLLSPDHDPAEDQALGNFYRKELAGWVKYRTIPGGVHNEDIYSFEGRLFVALQEEAVSGATDVQISDDNGITWQNITLTGGIFSTPTFRVPTLFEVAGNLYASSVFGVSTLWHYAGGNNFTQLSSAIASGMFPSTAQPPPLYVERWVPFAGQIVYLGVKSDPNDPLDWLPVGLYSATDVTTAQKLMLPSDGVAWDLVVSPSSDFPQTLYVLANNTISAAQNVVTVYSVTAAGPLTTIPSLTPLFTFTLNDGSFVRSFEIVNGDFYLGLGGNKASPPATTGNLLRVRQSDLPTNPTTTPATATSTATATLTPSPSPTRTNTATTPPASTPSTTPSPMSTGTLTRTLSPTATGLATSTPTATATGTALAVPSPTRTRTLTSIALPTGTVTRTATAAATPFPQPNVGVQVAPGNGGLQTMLTARDAGCNSNPQSRQLVALRFTRLANATVDVPGVGTIAASSAMPIPIPGHPAALTLTVHRVVAGQAATLEFVVTDGCGDWPTFVGGGPSAF